MNSHIPTGVWRPDARDILLENGFLQHQTVFFIAVEKQQSVIIVLNHLYCKDATGIMLEEFGISH